ncbi:MAG: S1C family serine protease [Phototrophicaceae bacterium]
MMNHKQLKQAIGWVWLAVWLVACAPDWRPAPVSLVATTPLAQLPNPNQAIATPVSSQVIDSADAEYQLLANLYERLTPSVVFVEVVSEETEFGTQDFGNGSGFIYDLNGHIVTNAHVVLSAQTVRITFHDGYVTTASVVGVDTFSDLAVVKVDTTLDRLYPISLGDSDATRVGERAIVIGNPFGLTSSMTVGIISAKGRQLPSAELINSTGPGGFQNPSIIQVDADINPGNSGGPLLNSRGEVVGVTTAIRSESGVFEGVGFAVPSSTLKRVAPDLIANGKVDYAWLGISAMSNEDGLGVAGLAESLNLPIHYGVMVGSVTPDSPAERGGLVGGNQLIEVRDRTVCVGGDIIIAVNGVAVRTMDELVNYLVVNTRPGDTVTMQVIRNRQTYDIAISLQERPSEVAPSRTCGEA